MRKKILILTANPIDTEKLSLDQEVREIQQGLERAKWREQFQILSSWATRPKDLRRTLLDYEPQIVHFSGHGQGAHGLILQDDEGHAKPVAARALARLFKLFEQTIECVLLNACYSETQAHAIHQHIGYVVGMNQAIGDLAAIKFAVGFYDALGAGRGYQEAYEFGCSALDLEDLGIASAPVLLCPVHPMILHEDGGDSIQEESELEEPEGQVPLNSPFYVERPPVEQDCYDGINHHGALIRIKAPRQMGKTSLRSGYFQNYLLSEVSGSLALGLDDVDEVFQYPHVAADFFALLRAWHERAKNDPGWQKLRLVIVHSKAVIYALLLPADALAQKQAFKLLARNEASYVPELVRYCHSQLNPRDLRLYIDAALPALHSLKVQDKEAFLGTWRAWLNRAKKSPFSTMPCNCSCAVNCNPP